MKKSTMKRALCGVLTMALSVSIVTPGVDVDAAKKASLKTKKITVTVGSKKTITIKNKNKKATYKIKASNKKVTVSKKGVVTGKKVGTATIKVTSKLKKKTTKVGTVKVTVVAKNNGVAETQAPVTSAQPTTTAVASSAPEASVAPVVSETPAPTVTYGEMDANYKYTIYNNYFEDGALNGLEASASNKIEICNTQNNTVGGMNSLLCTKRTQSTDGVTMAADEIMKEGESYFVSAYVMQKTSDSEKISFNITYQAADGSNATYVFDNVGSGVDCKNAEWVQVGGIFKVPAGAKNISLNFACASDKAEFYVDDVKVKAETGKDVTLPAEYQEMVEKSLYSEGNNARLKKAIEKARNGEDVNLAYIGGSVTEGALAQPNSNCYVSVSARAFAEKYGVNGGANVHCINAGMSGTSSDIGTVRYDRDVTGRLVNADHPDVLFIEFSVNDWDNATKNGGYEGLIRQGLKSGAAVVLIFSVFKKIGTVCEEQDKPFGKHYDLPMISMGTAVTDPEEEEGKYYSWYFGDDLHPNNTGYQLMSDCIMNLFDVVDKAPADEDNITDVDAMAPYLTDAYQGLKMIDTNTVAGGDLKEFNKGGFASLDSEMSKFQYPYKGEMNASWFPASLMHKTTDSADSLKVTANCKTFLILYKLSNSSKFGSADVYLDGKKVDTISCYDSSGWNNGKLCVVMDGSEEQKEHTIEIKMADEDKQFSIMAMAYR